MMWLTISDPYQIFKYDTTILDLPQSDQREDWSL